MWALTPEERLISWREFRNDISKLSKEEAIQDTATLWSTCPISTQYLAQDLIDDWPDPWSLMHDNCYDDIAITLGMVYTLALADDIFNDVEIHMLTNRGTGEEFHTAWFENGKYIINYEYGAVVSSNKLQRNLVTKYKYSYTDLLIDNYK